jgi:hypothetical protein
MFLEITYGEIFENKKNGNAQTALGKSSVEGNRVRKKLESPLLQYEI